MKAGSKVLIGCGVVVVLVVLAGLVLGTGTIGAYNNLVLRQERTNEGRSRFAGAINMSSEKMKAVWALADQAGLLEKETYIGVAKARTGLDEARVEFEKAEKGETKSILDLQKLGARVGEALVNVRVAFEAYPQLRTSETYQKAMATVQEGFSEIKTALDDWVRECRLYNTYRRSFLPNLLCSLLFGGKFPDKIAYYEGGIKEPEQARVTAEELNPKAVPAPAPAPGK